MEGAGLESGGGVRLALKIPFFFVWQGFIKKLISHSE